MVFGTELD